jgi:hypothetical protein
MTPTKKVFVDGTNDYFDLVDTYVNVNGVWLKPYEYMLTHDGVELGLQTLSLQGVEIEEVAFADLDLADSIGKYTVDPNTNSVILIVDKNEIGSEVTAIRYITGFLLEYGMINLEYYSTDSLYTMQTFSADGTFIGSTDASSTGLLVSKMNVLDSNQNINSNSGYYYHIIRRALQAA